MRAISASVLAQSYVLVPGSWRKGGMLLRMIDPWLVYGKRSWWLFIYLA